MTKFEKTRKILSEKKVEKEKLPEMEVTFIYGSHDTEEDAQLVKKYIKEHIKEIDVYCPEMKGWTPEFVEILNNISQGNVFFFEKYLRMAKKYPHWKTVLTAIYNSKKIISPIDVKQSEFSKKIEDILEIDEAANRNFYTGNLEEAIKNKKEYLKKDAIWQKRREKIILENLKRIPEKVRKEYPELKKKNQLKVLVSLGAFHTWLSRQIKEEGYPAKKIFTRMPYVFGHENEIGRKERFVFKAKPDDESVARSLTESSLEPYFKNFSDNSEKTTEASRIIASKTSFELIEKLSVHLKKEDIVSYKRADYITDFLRKHKIKVPEDEKELDKLIKDYEKKKFGR